MRRLSPILAMFAAALLFLSLGFGPQEKDQRAAAGEARTQAQTALNIEPYAPDPNHIWNRLFHLFYVRTAPNGRQYGGDELDPYLWQQTQYLLTGPSHGDALKLLNEFLDQHAERLITDPLPRALLQRDLWAVHDWLAIPYTEHQQEREQLRKPVAEIIHRLALTEEQIRALPDNYAAAVQSKRFPDRYNSDLPDTPFLPDLFRADGPWVCLGDQQGRVLPVLHLQEFRGRSAFLVFLRLPGERVEALAYLDKLRSIPSVWAPIPGSPRESVARWRHPAPPQFPAGTQVALVRQAVLISDQGRFVPSRLTESVQLRVYRSIPDHPEWSEARRSQGVFEFKLNRLTLARNAPGIEPAGVELRTSFTHGTDDFEWNPPPDVVERNHVYEGTLATRMCINCHQNPGVQSFTSYSRAQFPIPEQYSKVPPVLIESTPAREAELTARWRPQHPELNTYLLKRER